MRLLICAHCSSSPDAIKKSQQMIADMESNCKLMYKVRTPFLLDFSYKPKVVI